MTKPISTAERVAAHNARLADAGGARVTFRLSPEANAALDELARTTGKTRTAVVSELILRATQTGMDK